MNDKQKFGSYLTAKRKKQNLTQEELAEKLFVTSTTVSNWERGVTYPDISMITLLCTELQISEHEFFTACDDLAMHEKNAEIKNYERLKSIWKWTLSISYLIALITCFICNLAIDKTLSWFWIVLSAIALSFSITNLPLYLKKRHVGNKGIFVIGSMMVCTYILLAVCNWYTAGNWLFSAALPIATYEFAFVWAIYFLCAHTKWSGSVKAAGILFITAVIAVTTNPICGYLLNYTTTGNDNFSNILVAAALCMIACILLITDLAKHLKKEG